MMKNKLKELTIRLDKEHYEVVEQDEDSTTYNHGWDTIEGAILSKLITKNKLCRLEKDDIAQLTKMFNLAIEQIDSVCDHILKTYYKEGNIADG